MSDFLTNLAARAIAPPSLRPRTRSRFEPVGEEEGAGVVPERRLPAGRSAGVLAGVEVIAEEKQEAGWKPAERPAGGRRSEEATEKPRVLREVAREVQRQVQHDIQRVVETETQERVIRVPGEQRVEQVEVVRHRFDEQPPRVIKEAGTNTLRERTIRTTFDRANKPAKPQIIETQPTEREPTVHVSIGRIEVRAVPPAQPQQRSAQRGPSMSIDDYVAKRKSRERR